MSAGVLLVPPILIGGAVYGLLPAHDDRAARGSALAALESPPADFNSRSAFDSALDEPPPAVAALVSPATNAFVTASPAMPAATKPAAAAAADATVSGAVSKLAAAPPPVSAAPPPVSAATKPAAARDAPPAKPSAAPAKVDAPESTTFALASEHSEPVGKVTRVLGPVPVQVTVVVAPNATETEGEPVPLAAPPSATAAPPSTQAAAPPASAAVRSTEGPREHRASSPQTARSHFQHVVRRKEARTHPDEHATQRPADPPQPPQHEFSQRKLFKDQSGRQKGAVRG